MHIRFKFIWILLISVLPINVLAQDNYASGIQHYRDSLDAYFKSDQHSPLDSASRIDFTGLNYFEIDSNYHVYAKFEKKQFGEHFLMKTSTDRLPEYSVFGILYFELKGQKQQLTLYQNIALSKTEGYKDYLFCPFKDMTNGKESYGGGRYLDFRIGDLENCIIDFNLCYNPYCAYNHHYSCPIPPIENHLNIQINAGVKSR